LDHDDEESYEKEEADEEPGYEALAYVVWLIATLLEVNVLGVYDEHHNIPDGVSILLLGVD
jgi:hypothetical protein